MSSSSIKESPSSRIHFEQEEGVVSVSIKSNPFLLVQRYPIDAIHPSSHHSTLTDNDCTTSSTNSRNDSRSSMTLSNHNNLEIETTTNTTSIQPTPALPRIGKRSLPLKKRIADLISVSSSIDLNTGTTSIETSNKRPYIQRNTSSASPSPSNNSTASVSSSSHLVVSSPITSTTSSNLYHNDHNDDDNSNSMLFVSPEKTNIISPSVSSLRDESPPPSLNESMGTTALTPSNNTTVTTATIPLSSGNNHNLKASSPPSSKLESYDVVWNRRLEELRDYKEKHGHCDVPSVYDENRPLGTWVMNQRQQYRKAKLNDKGGSMSSERIQLLEDMGFKWVLGKGMKSKVSTNSNGTTTSTSRNNENLMSQIKVSTILSVLWDDDGKYYSAKVKNVNNNPEFTIEYEDGEEEILDLSDIPFRIVGKDDFQPINPEVEEEEKIVVNKKIDHEEKEDIQHQDYRHDGIQSILLAAAALSTLRSVVDDDAAAGDSLSSEEEEEEEEEEACSKEQQQQQQRDASFMKKIPDENPNGVGLMEETTHPNTWQCTRCTLFNDHSTKRCEACGLKKTSSDNTWTCKTCNRINSTLVTKCSNNCTSVSKQPKVEKKKVEKQKVGKTKVEKTKLDTNGTINSNINNNNDANESAWVCHKCKLTNKSISKRCRACSAWRGGKRIGAFVEQNILNLKDYNESDEEGNNKKIKSKSLGNVGSGWVCHKCRKVNDRESKRCKDCFSWRGGKRNL